MLQQVAHLAPLAPQDRGSVSAEAMAAGGVPQAGGFDFPAMLAQAEAQEQVTPPVEIAPAEIATENGMSGPTAGVEAGFVPAMAVPIRQNEAVQDAGHEGADLSAGIPLAGDRPRESGVDLINGPPPGLLTQEEVSPSDLCPVAVGLTTMGRDAVTSAPTALAVKVPAGDLAGTDRPAPAQASDPHPEAVEHAALQDPAEDVATTSVVRLEPPVAQPTGQTPTLMAGPLLPEGHGLSMPADPPMAGAGSLPGHVGLGPSSSPAAAGLGLPYQRLFHSQLSAQVAPAVLTMGVSPGADGGPGRLTLAIRPAELGTLQIIAEKTEDRTARIAVLAERPETLQLLVRDAPTLEAALRAAGVGEGGGLSLTFGLASQGQGDRGGDARGEASGDAGRGDGAVPEPSVIAAALVMARTSLVDLSL